MEKIGLNSEDCHTETSEKIKPYYFIELLYW